MMHITFTFSRGPCFFFSPITFLPPSYILLFLRCAVTALHNNNTSKRRASRFNKKNSPNDLHQDDIRKEATRSKKQKEQKRKKAQKVQEPRLLQPKQPAPHTHAHARTHTQPRKRKKAAPSTTSVADLGAAFPQKAFSGCSRSALSRTPVVLCATPWSPRKAHHCSFNCLCAKKEQGLLKTVLISASWRSCSPCLATDEALPRPLPRALAVSSNSWAVHHEWALSGSCFRSSIFPP